MRAIGASGFVKITAPFPYADSTELPYWFEAMIFAKMLEPQGRLNGACLSVEIGIEQRVS